MTGIDQWTDHSVWQAWWKLSRVKGLGVVLIHRLRSGLEDPAILLNSSDQQLHELGLSYSAIADFRAPLTRQQQNHWDQMLDWISIDQQFIVTMIDQDYPESLAALNDPPVALFGHGNRSILASANHRKSGKVGKVAIVGSRNASPAGRQWAYQTAQQLAELGVIVVSGLAVGIDAVAHEGALASGSTNATIAVLGSGVDRIYPRKHFHLAQQIINRGCLLSEYHLGTAPLAAHFPSRNRLISGLVDAVIIVEAKLKSGSMITARLAAEQGREVMAVPGPVQNPSSHGPHQLIKDGAILVESVADIINNLGHFDISTTTVEEQRISGCSPKGGGSSQAPVAAELRSEQVDSTPIGIDTPTVLAASSTQTQTQTQVPAVVSCIDFVPTTFDAIVARSQRPVAWLLAELMELELQGWIQQVAGGYIRRR